MSVVLNRIKERTSDWKHAGYSAHYAYNGYVALAVEVRADEASAPGWVVSEVAAVLDAGTVINPSGARAQVEGSILFALSAAFWGEVIIKQERVTQRNFHDMPVIRCHQIPEIQIDWVDSAEAPAGLGEVAVPCVAPAVANALAQLVGRTFDTLPLVSS